AGWSSFAKGLSDEERALVREGLQEHYDAFVARVAAGRDMTRERAEELAQGRVYMGRAAVEHGLVDALGSFADAVREAKRRARIALDVPVHIAIPEAPLSLSLRLSPFASAEAQPLGAIESLHALASELRAIAGRPLALMPFVVELEP